jgi:Protein of unknown function (DUF2637)
VSASTEAMVWRPSRELVGMLLAAVGLVVGLVGVMAFVLSFDAVNQASMPFFGPLAFMIPLLGDLTIAVMTAYRLLAELYGLSAPLAKWSARVLIALTVYLNAGHAAGLFGHVIHAAPPIVWALIVEVGQTTIRQLVGLDAPSRIERMRASLWLLRPWPTFVTWRRMRVQQIPTYREAIDLEAATLAVRGRLRVLHGRGWRRRAPLAERLSLRLLRRGQREVGGVAAVLHEQQMIASLLQGASEPASADASEPASGAGQPALVLPSARRIRTVPLAGAPDPLAAEALRLDRANLALGGGPISMRSLQRQLSIGQARATELRTWLDEQGVQLQHANGSTI